MSVILWQRQEFLVAKFLSALNDKYTAAKSQLSVDPTIPTLQSAFSRLRRVSTISSSSTTSQSALAVPYMVSQGRGSTSGRGWGRVHGFPSCSHSRHTNHLNVAPRNSDDLLILRVPWSHHLHPSAIVIHVPPNATPKRTVTISAFEYEQLLQFSSASTTIAAPMSVIGIASLASSG